MKRFVLGLIIGLLAFPAVSDLAKLGRHFTNSPVVEYIYDVTFVPGYGLEAPFTENCTKDVSKNGHGWVFVNREYFKCGKLAIMISDLIYGEYTQEETKDEQQ